ncbi:multiple C2 and transmembrane domain-containing protein 2-like [Myxocyprinus asiaticus]|uniref:multiple C2 and transmembrane domain-containing protein 2-like n=1 Tax=Myxocyprinus asiaticus TaxID=70543 RepID=UPI002222F517|nr:multiple C2 and transmembrane domain-containing protein 2-like [Myxocyprinus asiaticus]XP_051512808.1 multiple C2 and transmembrane domain-containing protein 2-like [Myxocyprinus asiaticus]
MEHKKRVWPKLKIGKMGLGKKKKTPLKYRRSMSVPDLRFTPHNMPALEDDSRTPVQGTIFFGNLIVPDDIDGMCAFSDQFTATDTPYSCSPAPSERSMPADFPVSVETTVDKNSDQPRNTTWYIEDLDAAPTPTNWASVPAERTSPALRPKDPKLVAAFCRANAGRQTPTAHASESEISALASTESVSTTSEKQVWHTDQETSPSEMFIIGSAEDMEDDIPNETSDFDTLSLPEEEQNIISGGLSDSQISLALQKVQYLLTIKLKEGRNLVVRDRSGTSDPFVKFKLGGKNIYKSKVVNKNLNPTWNESFSFPVRDLDQTVHIKVYDRDIRSNDFMGSSSFALYKLELDKTIPLTLCLEDPNSVEEDMGVIIIEASLSIREEPAKRNKWLLRRKGSFNKGQPISQAQVARLMGGQKCQVWSGVYSVILVEGQDMPDCGQGDIYVRFRVGDQRVRSKNLCIKANPQWKESFDFNQFQDAHESLVVEVCCKRGRKSEECWGVLEIDLTKLPVNQRQLYTRVLDPGKGRLVFLVTLTPCSGVSISDMQSAPLENPRTYEKMLEQYRLSNSLGDLKEVGYLQIKLIKATDLSSADISGKSDPFCTLELGNSKLQTHTVSKTLNPEWKTALTFPIKDIHDVLVLTVYHDDGDKAPDFLGKVAIPLLSVSNGQQITRMLKNNNLSRAAKGSITLELDVIYNPIRASIKTFQPKETKFAEDNPKFNKKLLACNIYRVRKISMAILYTLQYIKSCFHWENTQRSITAFLIFVVTVWLWELFMLPLFLLLLIGWNYFHITPGMASYSQDLESMSMVEDEDEDEKESEKRGLMEKIHMVQEIVLTVQNTLDEVACIGERVKNTFNWSIPFLSFLACLVLFLATIALYFIPLRYIILLWGVNKFTKKLRNPYAIDNNEILDFLKRVPSDIQKVQYSELRAELSNQGLVKKKRLR